MISMMSNNIQNLLEKAKEETIKLEKQLKESGSESNSRTSSPSSLSPASTASFGYFKSAGASESGEYVGAKKSKLNTSRDSGDDPRTMDAADTLVSLAHSAASTPTVESKPLLPVTKTNNFEICINPNELQTGESTSEKEEGKDVANQQAVESACKIILQQVLKSCPGANLSSITIKTTTQPVNADSATTTTTTLQIKPNGSALAVVNESATEPETQSKKESAAAAKSEFVRTPTALNSKYPHFYHTTGKRNSSISSMTSLSSQSVVSALSTPSSEDIFTMRNLINMDEADNELMSSLRSTRRPGDAGTPVETPGNVTLDSIMSLINMSKTSSFSAPVSGKSEQSTVNEASKTQPLKRPSSISAKQGGFLTTSSLMQPVPLKASSPIPATSPSNLFPTVKSSPAKKLNKKDSTDAAEKQQVAKNSSEPKTSKRPIKEENEDTLDPDMSDSDYDYSDDSSDSINGEIYRKADSSGKKRRKNDEANTSLSRSAPTLATGRRSKDTELPPDEAKKRQERRERNKEAAARCRRKREELTTTLTRKTEQLNKERENLRQLVEELAREKSRLESTFMAHEKSCKSIAKPVPISLSPNKAGPSSQSLLRIKKEEINEIIKQSSERKLKQSGGQHLSPTTPQLINSLVSASAAFPSGFSSLLTPQSEHHPFHHASFNSSFNAVLSNLNEAAAKNAQQKSDGSSNATVAAINELLAAAVNQHQQQQQHQHQQSYQQAANKMESYFESAAQQQQQQQQQQQSPSGSSASTPGSSIQRPNNLNLKSPQSSKPTSQTQATSSAALVQELFASFNGAGTPLQLNTPIIFALTPLEATLNTLNAFAANCTTPVLSQQASTFLTPNSASLAHHTEQFNALNDAFMNGSSIYSNSSANNYK